MKKFCSMATWLIVAFLLFSFFGYSSAAVKTEWTYPVLPSSGQYARDGMDWFATQVFERSNGHIKIFTQQYAEVGLRGFENLTMTKNGSYPIIEVVTGYAGGEIPALTLYSAPYVITGPKEGVKVLKDTHNIRQRELDKFNAIDIPLYKCGPPLCLFSNKPVRKLTDLKGLKVRAPGRIIASYVTALGATPVTTASAEAYTALQRGTVDAALTAAYSAISHGFHEVTRYVTLFDTPVVTFTVVNKESWSTLPKNVQDIILKAAGEATDRLTTESISEIAATPNKIRAKGLEYIELPPEEEAKKRGIALNLWDTWAQKSGPAGQELIKAIWAVTGR